MANSPPQSISDLSSLIEEQVQENLHLDYKASAALTKDKKDEVAKDVSALANADGGCLIYGITENKHFPVRLDDGVPNDSINREWVENVILGNISPIIPGVKITQLPINNTHSYYVISIEKSYSGPHQAPDKRYYKRYNFQSAPMHDYEIKDVRNRKYTISRLVSIDIEVEGTSVFLISINNPGGAPAENVLFRFSQELNWEHHQKPPALENGIKYLPPGRKLRFYYASAVDVFSANYNGPKKFEISVSYKHTELDINYSETFFFDFQDFLYSANDQSLSRVLADEIKNGVKVIVSAIKSIR